MKRYVWNKCDYCGKFIGIQDMIDGKAERYMVTPDSEYSVETWDTHHRSCKLLAESTWNKPKDS
jgi:hypothetical protein